MHPRHFRAAERDSMMYQSTDTGRLRSTTDRCNADGLPSREGLQEGLHRPHRVVRSSFPLKGEVSSHRGTFNEGRNSGGRQHGRGWRPNSARCAGAVHESGPSLPHEEYPGGPPSPGLKRQHLACVRAAGELCGAKSQETKWPPVNCVSRPGPARAGEYHFAVGGGGSATLLLQAVLPPLLTADTPSRITVTGGTHVPCAPPFEFMAGTLLPWLERMGPRLAATMSRPGYMQIGGGSVTVNVTPAKALVFGTDFAEAAKMNRVRHWKRKRLFMPSPAGRDCKKGMRRASLSRIRRARSFRFFHMRDKRQERRSPAGRRGQCRTG